MILSFREAAPIPITDIHDNQSRVQDSFPKMDILDNLPPTKNKPKIKLFLDKERMEVEKDISMGLNGRNLLNNVK